MLIFVAPSYAAALSRQMLPVPAEPVLGAWREPARSTPTRCFVSIFVWLLALLAVFQHASPKQQAAVVENESGECQKTGKAKNPTSTFASVYESTHSMLLLSIA